MIWVGVSVVRDGSGSELDMEWIHLWIGLDWVG